eukprot:Opistho-1_new@31498
MGPRCRPRAAAHPRHRRLERHLVRPARRTGGGRVARGGRRPAAVRPLDDARRGRRGRLLACRAGSAPARACRHARVRPHLRGPLLRRRAGAGGGARCGRRFEREGTAPAGAGRPGARPRRRRRAAGVRGRCRTRRAAGQPGAAHHPGQCHRHLAGAHRSAAAPVRAPPGRGDRRAAAGLSPAVRPRRVQPAARRLGRGLLAGRLRTGRQPAAREAHPLGRTRRAGGVGLGRGRPHHAAGPGPRAATLDAGRDAHRAAGCGPHPAHREPGGLLHGADRRAGPGALKPHDGRWGWLPVSTVGRSDAHRRPGCDAARHRQDSSKHPHVLCVD